MANNTAISDEQIIAGLMSAGTIREAAATVGLSERAIYDRMTGGDFQTLYKAAKADLIRAAVLNLNKQLQAAIDTVVNVMQDETNNAAIRLQAAQTILNNAGKFSQRLQIVETSVITETENNRFSLW